MKGVEIEEEERKACRSRFFSFPFNLLLNLNLSFLSPLLKKKKQKKTLQNVPTNYGSTLMNNVQSGSLNAPRTAITGSQDNFYESCPSQAARLALPGAPCAAAMEALKQFSAGLATAECRIVGLAMRSQPTVIPPDCCPALRQFVRDGCACDTETRAIAPAANVKIIDLVAAARVAQVSLCATDEYGGAIPNPCRNIQSCEVNALQGQNMPTPAPSSLLPTGTDGAAKSPPPPAAGGAAAAGAAAAASASAAAQPRPPGSAAVPNTGPSHIVPERVGILGAPMEKVDVGGKASAATTARTAPTAPNPAAGVPAAAAATNAAAPRADPVPVVALTGPNAAGAGAAAAALVEPATADTVAPAAAGAQKPPAAAAACSTSTSAAAAATTAPPQQPVPPQGSGMLRQVFKQQQQQRERPERPERREGPPPHRRRRGSDGDDGGGAASSGNNNSNNRRTLLAEGEPPPASAAAELVDPAALFAEDEADGSLVPLKPEEAAAIQASADATAEVTDPDPTPPPTKQAAAAAAAAAASSNPVPVSAVVAEGGVAPGGGGGKLSRVTAAAVAAVPQPGKLSRMSDPTTTPPAPTPAPKAVSAAAPSSAAKKLAPAPAPSAPKAAVAPAQAGWLGAVPLPPKPAPTPKPVAPAPAPAAAAAVAGGAVVPAKPGATVPSSAAARAASPAKKETPVDWKWGPHPAKWFASWPRVWKDGEVQKFMKTPGVGNLPAPNPYYVPTAKEQEIADKKAAKTPPWVKYEEKEQEREDKGVLHPLHIFMKEAPPPGKLNPMRALIAPTTRKYIEGYKWVRFCCPLDP